MEMEGGEKKKIVCVTGAGGFLASWVVKFLLSKGYTVHGTVRDASDEKNAHLKKLDKASENLKLFKADLLDYNALSAAVAGCEGVFHVASPVPASKVPNPEFANAGSLIVEQGTRAAESNQVQDIVSLYNVELFAPAKEGTLNVLKASSKAKVKRTVVVSSTAAVSMNPNWPKDKVMDEECWSDKEYCRITENLYCLSKTLAEGEAFDYASKHGLDVVRVCPSMVFGPLLQSTVNASSSFLVNILNGKRESLVNDIWHFVDVRDVADSLILVYENPEASGRYICAPHALKLRDFVDILKEMYPNYEYPKKFTEGDEMLPLSCEKLKKLGWEPRPLKETLVDTVECYMEAGLVNKA